MKKYLVTAAFLGLLLLMGARLYAAQEKTLELYTWSEYMPDEVLKLFTRETGIKVSASTYDSNETMYAKVKTLKGKGYDVIVPSTYFVSRMRNEGMLIKLDKAKLPNLKNLDPKLLDGPHDPGGEYSAPYLWGTTGISMNNKLVPPGSIHKWADLWDSRYKSSILLLDDVRDVFSMALKTLGYSINDMDEVHIREAYQKLKDLLPNIKVFNSETPKVLFIEEEVALGMNWNGESYKATKENGHIGYVYPKEGALLWMDSLVIPQGAVHVENAHKFIDFLLRPEIARMVCEEIGYATPNLEAVKLLPKEIRENRTIYPADEDLGSSEFQTDVGDAIAIYEKYWEALKVDR
jgi:spermidine/putrescine transport system substrate-binding protein